MVSDVFSFEEAFTGGISEFRSIASVSSGLGSILAKQIGCDEGSSSSSGKFSLWGDPTTFRDNIGQCPLLRALYPICQVGKSYS